MIIMIVAQINHFAGFFSLAPRSTKWLPLPLPLPLDDAGKSLFENPGVNKKQVPSVPIRHQTHLFVFPSVQIYCSFNNSRNWA